MGIIGFYLIAVGILALVLPSTGANKKYFIIISGFFLFLIAALRSIYFGSDAIEYVYMYNSLSGADLYGIISDFFAFARKDPVFYLVAKVFSLSGLSEQVWLAAISAVFCFFVFRHIYIYSAKPYMSIVAFISLGFFYFSLSGLRQTLALAFVLFSYDYLIKRKLAKFVFTIILGALFHSSALIFLIAYPIVRLKTGFKHYAAIVSAFLIAVFFSNHLREFIAIVGWSDAISSYAQREVSLNISGTLIQLSILVFCIYYKNRMINIDKNYLSFLNLLFIGCFFQIFSIVIAEFFRVSMYFSIFSLSAIPAALSTEREKGLQYLAYTILLIIFTVYIIWQDSFHGYEFFWN